MGQTFKVRPGQFAVIPRPLIQATTARERCVSSAKILDLGFGRATDGCAPPTGLAAWPAGSGIPFTRRRRVCRTSGEQVVDRDPVLVVGALERLADLGDGPVESGVVLLSAIFFLSSPFASTLQ
jgi:hypothetical protein